VWEAEREDFEELAEAEVSNLHSTTGHDITAPAGGHARHSTTTPAAATRHNSATSHNTSTTAAAAPAHISHAAAATILRTNALRHFWPRLVATCCGWLANDFACVCFLGRGREQCSLNSSARPPLLRSWT
jgi:hypothetical protein